MRVLVSTIVILALLPCCADGGEIGLDAFSADAIVEEYEGVGDDAVLSTPLLIGGDTYTSDSGFIEVGGSFGNYVSSSGTGLSTYTDSGTIEITLETPTTKVGLYTGLHTQYYAQVRFFNEDGDVLGTVYTSGSGGSGVFAGWEADVGLVASLAIKDRYSDDRPLYIDHLIKEAPNPNFPVLPDIPEQRAYIGELFTYDVDAVTAIPCVYTLNDYPPTGMTIDPDTGVIEWTPFGMQIGTHSVTVTATNSAGAASTTFKIIVPNVAPEITPIPDVTVTVGEEWSYHIWLETFYLSPSPDYTLTEGPDGMTLFAQYLSWTPTVLQVGEHLVTVKVENSVGYDTESFTITVVDDGQPRAFTLTVEMNGPGQIAPGIGSFEYPEGTDVSVVATPDTDAHFIVWGGTAVTSGRVADRLSPTTSVTMYEDYTIKGYFEHDRTDPHRLHVFAPQDGGGWIWKPGSSGTFERSAGFNITLAVRSNEGYRFAGWGGSAVTSGAITDLTDPMQFLKMDDDYTVTAWFEPGSGAEYTLDISATNGGTVLLPGEGSLQYWDGAIPYVRAEADVDHRFVGWTGTAVDAGRVEDPSEEITILTVDADYTLIANFEEGRVPRYTLTVSAAEGGHVAEPGEGDFVFDKNTKVSIVAEPDPGYTFARWVGTAVDAGQVPEPMKASTYVTLDTDYTVEATFRHRTLTLSSTPGGQVTIPGEGVFEYDDGEQVEIEAVADADYHFSHWSGTINTSDRVTTIAMTVDHNIQANFIGVNSLLFVDNAGPSDPDEDGTPEHPFDTIQEAIEIASERSVITVRPGVYRECIDFLGKTIRLTSLDPDAPAMASYPVIDGDNMGPVVTLASGENEDCMIEGFVITRGLGQNAGGLYCQGTSPTVSHCLVVGNRVTSPQGAAIYCGGGDPVLMNCTVSGNYGGPQGAGILLEAGSAVVSNSIVQDNLPRDILVSETATPDIRYCNIATDWTASSCIAEDAFFVMPGYWTDSTGSVTVAPVDPDAVWVDGDYHLKSRAGHWDSETETWVYDDATSPCIDAGDPSSSIGSEPGPHGDRINMGVYGGTMTASRSASNLTGEEDFETGGFGSFGWTHQGQSPWRVVDTMNDLGAYCAQAGPIANNETSTLSLTLNCRAGEITFFCRVSSEPDFDVLRFEIDGVEVGRWSGAQPWTQVSFEVAAGKRTFTWTYSKDESMSAVVDTAWIDDIVFPIQ